MLWLSNLGFGVHMDNIARLKKLTKNLNIECDFWDIRIESSFETAIEIVDSAVITCTSNPSLGAFIRLRKNGFWFYESTTDLENLDKTLIRLANYKTISHIHYPFIIKKNSAFSKLMYTQNNFSTVELNSKLNLMESYSKFVRVEDHLQSHRIHYKDIYKIKSYINSVGTEFEYDFNQGGFSVRYTLKEGKSIFEDKIIFYGSSLADLENKNFKISNSVYESRKFLNAPVIVPGKYSVLFDPETSGVFTHESFGHKSEADFMLGDEKLMQDWKIGSLIASTKLSIVDCGQHENVSGYCPIDDEGTLAQKNYLIKNGILIGRLHSIDTSLQLNEKPTGNARAMNFEFEPIVRMTSTYIEPGKDKIEDIIQKAEGALLIKGVKHGSGLSTFTIAPHKGYIIQKNSELKPVRVSVVSGSVFETLKKIDQISSDFQMHSSALGGCGKMNQWPLSVSYGGPYILVKDMQVS